MDANSGKYKTWKPWGWRKRSRIELAMSPLCVMWQAHGQLTPAQVTDHVIPHRGDPALFWRGKTQQLCWSCHSALKQSQESSTGFHCAIDEFGNPADPQHPWNVVGREGFQGLKKRARTKQTNTS